MYFFKLRSQNNQFHGQDFFFFFQIQFIALSISFSNKLWPTILASGPFFRSNASILFKNDTASPEVKQLATDGDNSIGMPKTTQLQNHVKRVSNKSNTKNSNPHNPIPHSPHVVHSSTHLKYAQLQKHSKNKRRIQYTPINETFLKSNFNRNWTPKSRPIIELKF